MSGKSAYLISRLGSVTSYRGVVRAYVFVGAGLICSLGFFGCGGAMGGEVAKLRASLNDMRSIQAEQGAQLAQLNSEVRAIQGKQEELEFLSARQIGGEVASLRGELSSLKGRVPPPSSVPARLLEQDERTAHALPSQVGSRLIEGLRLLREGQFLDAVSVLKSSIDAAGGGEGADLALFWVGIGYDSVRDDRNALFAFNEVVTKYPSSPRASAALLRQAQLFRRLGDKPAEETTLQKLERDFPRSPEARIAKSRLKGKK